MYVGLATTCEYASDMGGVLNIIGARSLWTFPSLPVRLQVFCVVFQIVAEPEDYNQTRSVRLSFTDPDGSDVIPAADLPLDFLAPDEALGLSSGQLVMRIPGHEFSKRGKYRVNIDFDGNELSSISFAVVVKGEK